MTARPIATLFAGLLISLMTFSAPIIKENKREDFLPGQVLDSSDDDLGSASLKPSGIMPRRVLNRPKVKTIRLNSFSGEKIRVAKTEETPLIFDLPVTYNRNVKKWINFFQSNGKKWFRRWLERSYRYIPMIQEILVRENLPKDLAYVAMIESGFSAKAVSSASAVGPWQFMKATGKDYGLRANWWLDERRDFKKSTVAAAKYLSRLYPMFDSWYLAAAAYNMGENRLKRLIKRYGTKDFWKLSENRGFATETKDYVPKLIAAVLISKAPRLYGFRNVYPLKPFKYEMVSVPGGVDLVNLADFLGVKHSYLKGLNAELVQGFIPKTIARHKIRVPKNSSEEVKRFVMISKGLASGGSGANKRRVYQ